MNNFVKILLIFLSIIFLSACGPADNDAEIYTVSFESNGGTDIHIINVEEGKSILEPTHPIKDGNAFLGWYSDSLLNNTYDFTNPVIGDVILYAKWDPVQLTLSFDTNGGELVSDIDIDYNTIITQLDSPEKFGFTFLGWYLDSELTTLFDFTEGIITDNILYASWTVNEYTITFESNGGSSVANIVQEYNTTVTRPITPINGDLEFYGWYTNSALTIEYDFDTAIFNDITLYAKWNLNVLRIFQNKVEIDNVLRDYAEAWGIINNVEVEIITCGGDTCSYGTQILAEFQGDQTPDIFVIQGLSDFNYYESYILDLTGEEWADDTDLEFTVDGATYGFPVAIEGWGMAFNQEILEAAFAHEGLGRTIESLSVISQAEYAEVFAAIQAYYDANNMDDYAVVSMAASTGMTWVTGLHNFNGYLSAGLDYHNSSIIDDLNDGIAHIDRLNALADWVELLFTWGDETILLTGGYDEQVDKFADGKAAFLHQGNWTDSSYSNSNFEIGFLPHATMATGNDSIFIGVPAYYVINKNSNSTELAKQFLNDLALTTEGHEYMVNGVHMVPAFNSVTIIPSTPLSASVMEYNQLGKTYAWWQNDMPSGFGMNILGPIYELYARGVKDIPGGTTKAEFISQIKAAIEDLE